jgi:hypothetical protein
MAAFRQGEVQRKHREGMRQEQEDQAHKSEYLMDQTTWGEWKKSQKLVDSLDGKIDSSGP